MNTYTNTNTNKKVEGYREDLVVQQLSEAIETKSTLRIAIYDYGGQEVFYAMHHLFLRRNAVYVLAFDMQWMCAKATQTEQKRCLAFLEFWINSIVVHTANNNHSYGNNVN